MWYSIDMRNMSFVENEFYHVFNRGVEKRDIFLDIHDLHRFCESMDAFNQVKNIGSLRDNSKLKKNRRRASGDLAQEKLVNFIAYCANQNHFHFILEQVTKKGVEKFMHKLGTGYSKYFNAKYKRSGSLFQGKFKAKHVDSNDYLLHLSAYVNLNNKAHEESTESKLKLSRSSWDEYNGKEPLEICRKEVILGQFKNKQEYVAFAESSLLDIVRRKENLKDLEELIK